MDFNPPNHFWAKSNICSQHRALLNCSDDFLKMDFYNPGVICDTMVALSLFLSEGFSI